MRVVIDERQSEYEPDIEAWSAEGDALATKMRRCYRLASEAFDRGEKADAKAYSLEGHAAQDACQQVNARKDALIDELKALHDQYARDVATIATVREEIGDVRSQLQVAARTDQPVERERATPRTELPPSRLLASPSRSTIRAHGSRVIGFDRSRIAGSREVADLVRELPAKIFEHVAEIRYIGEEHYEGIRTALGLTTRSDPISIQIFRHPRFADKAIAKELFIQTLLHEAGHALWRTCMTRDEIDAWTQLHFASVRTDEWLNSISAVGREHDFGEALQLLLLEPRVLRKSDPERYKLVNAIYNRVKKESSR